MSTVYFEEVNSTPEIIDNLFHLLSKRKHSISHEKMPEYDEHAKFVTNHPYRKWWTVRKEDKLIGSVYLTDGNAIGINLLLDDVELYKEIIIKVTEENEPLESVASVNPAFFHINSAPTNKALIQAIEEVQGRLTQYSYRIDKN